MYPSHSANFATAPGKASASIGTRLRDWWKNDATTENENLRQDYYDLMCDLSHDIRTPLCVIREYAALMREGVLGPIDSAQSDAMDIICVRSDEIRLLVDTVLLKAKLAAGEVEPQFENVSLHELLDDPVAHLVELSRMRQLKLHTDVVNPPPVIVCDPSLTRHILTCLWHRVARVADLHTVIRLDVSHEQESRRVVFRFMESRIKVLTSNSPAEPHAPSSETMQRIEEPQGDLVLDAVCELVASLRKDVHVAQSAGDLYGLELSLPASGDAIHLSTETERQ